MTLPDLEIRRLDNAHDYRSIRLEALRDAPEAFVWGFFVRHDCRKHGVGEALIAAPEASGYSDDVLMVRFLPQA